MVPTSASFLAPCVSVNLCSAKFEHNYRGIVLDGVQACISNSNLTMETVTLRNNCRDAFTGIMNNIPNEKQSILSSGSSRLALVSYLIYSQGLLYTDLWRRTSSCLWWRNNCHLVDYRTDLAFGRYLSMFVVLLLYCLARSCSRSPYPRGHIDTAQVEASRMCYDLGEQYRPR
jgi:hypothetical protein